MNVSGEGFGTNLFKKIPRGTAQGKCIIVILVKLDVDIPWL